MVSRKQISPSNLNSQGTLVYVHLIKLPNLQVTCEKHDIGIPEKNLARVFLPMCHKTLSGKLLQLCLICAYITLIFEVILP